MPDKLRLAVCRNLEREIAAILQSVKVEEVEVTSLAPLCHRPWPAANPEMKRPDVSGKEACNRTVIIGCDYLRRAFPPSPAVEPDLWPGANQCFQILIGKELTEHLIKEGAFLLTPGWLANWRSYVGFWGFDERTAREFFAETAGSLVLLDTGVDPRIHEYLEAFAAFVARPARTIPVGVGNLRLHLLNLLLTERLRKQGEASKGQLSDANRKLGDFAMAYDLIGRLTAANCEATVVKGILELFEMLCAPGRLVYVPLNKGNPGAAQAIPPTAAEEPQVLSRLARLTGEYERSGSKSGFCVRIGEPGNAVGILELEGLAFPQYQEHYLNLALSLAKVCGLAVRNARVHEELERRVAELQTALANVKTLSGLIPICAWCKKIRNDQGYWKQLEFFLLEHSEARFSHGVCPECARKLEKEIAES